MKRGVLLDEGCVPLQGGGYLPADPFGAARLFSRAATLGSALGLFNYGWALVYG